VQVLSIEDRTPECSKFRNGAIQWRRSREASQKGADMVRIEVDTETAKKIEDASEPIEIYASDGRQIGFFSHPISSDEIAEARRLASLPSNGRSIDEVWDRIRGRGEAE